MEVNNVENGLNRNF